MYVNTLKFCDPVSNCRSRGTSWQDTIA